MSLEKFIQNPVLMGFHPDPVMCYINNTFYIANSTFEYYPGIKLSKSTDLANWETVGYPLKHNKHINLIGIRNSCGIWAPCMSHCDGITYLIYTEVRSFIGENNCKNYITYTDDIEGDNWSKPIFINSQGFDPSLFHDTDGRKYFVSMEFSYKKEWNYTKFLGILLTELDAETLKPISEPVKIFEGEYIEGIHIYKKDNFYYIVGANGGTSYEHGALIARSKNIYGDYEFMPNNEYLVTTKNNPKSYLQKAGHASLVEDKDGRWWTAFLVGRPLGIVKEDNLEVNKNCPLGRETAIAEVEWVDGWPRLKSGGTTPNKEFVGYGEQQKLTPINYKFTDEKFSKDFQSLRQPAHYDILDDGSLRLYGKENIMSTYFQNMLITRQQHFRFEASTCVVNENRNSKVMGGLIYRYSEQNQYYLQFTFSDELDENILEIIAVKNGEQTEPLLGKQIVIHSNEIHLKVIAEYEIAKFYYSLDSEDFIEIEYEIDVNILSDENDKPIGFTGAMVGMVAQDLIYDIKHCDFKYFKYSELID